MSQQGSSGSNKKTRFADLVKDVKPLHSDYSNRTEENAPKPNPLPHETVKDHERVLKESLDVDLELEDMQPGDSLSFRGYRIRKNTFRKLKRGQYSIGAALDLHGMTIAEAKIALMEFIKASREKNIQCVQVIHGKGHGSHNQAPKLKPMVNQWLQKREEILAFCSARPVDGGTGAVYVLLKSLN